MNRFKEPNLLGWHPKFPGIVKLGVIMADRKYPGWQRQYEAVLLEFDPSRVRELVAAAEDAIFARFQALSPSPSGQDERQAIADAVNALYIVKRDILKFPGLDFDQSKATQEVSELD